MTFQAKFQYFLKNYSIYDSGKGIKYVRYILFLINIPE